MQWGYISLSTWDPLLTPPLGTRPDWELFLQGQNFLRLQRGPSLPEILVSPQLPSIQASP